MTPFFLGGYVLKYFIFLEIFPILGGFVAEVQKKPRKNCLAWLFCIFFEF